MRATVARAYLLAGLVMIGAYLANAEAFVGVYTAIGLASAGLIFIGVAVNRPRASLAWNLVGLGQLLMAVGDLVYGVYSSAPFPSGADALYLAGDGALIAGIALLTIGDRGTRSFGGYLDALVVSLSIGVLSWAVFLSKSMDGSSVPANVVSHAYPIADLVLLGLLIRMSFIRRRPTFSFCALVASVLLLFAADGWYVVPALANNYSDSWVDAGWLASYVLAAVAALHPSMRQFVDGDARTGELGVRRVVLLGASLIAVAVGAALEQAVTGHLDVYDLAAIGSLMVVAVFVRLGMLVRDLNALRAEAAAAERRFRLMFESAPVGISLGNDGMLTETNPALQRMLGYTQEELSELHYTSVTHPDDLAVATSDDAAYAADKRYIRKDGSILDAHVHIAQSADGAFSIGLVEDTTERRALEEQLLQSQKMEAIGKLAGGIAHDFNNLTLAIGGYGELLLSELDEDDPRRRRVVEIGRAAARAADLTRQLLAFSRRQVLQPRLVDMRVVVTELTSLLHRVIGRSVVLETTLDARPVVVLADPGQLEQVLLNLVVNARDAMERGGSIAVEVRADGAEAVLSVADTGVGMDEDVRAQVFEPFFSTKPPDQGTGLGLSTAYGIVAQSGGSIDVTSAPGEGSTFVVRLPLRSETAVDGGEEPVRARVPEADQDREDETAGRRKHPAREPVEAHDRHLRDVSAEERAA
jgi:PAS domain S-box-containing protein